MTREEVRQRIRELKEQAQMLNNDITDLTHILVGLKSVGQGDSPARKASELKSQELKKSIAEKRDQRAVILTELNERIHNPLDSAYTVWVPHKGMNRAAARRFRRANGKRRDNPWGN